MTEADARAHVAERYRLLEAGDRPEAWITLRAEHDVAEEFAAIAARVAAGEHLPLAGTLFAVKNNIDVVGIDTTAACPAFAYAPDEDAATVARLRAAGAVVLGSTNLDQFATGLVGSRSPYGAVRHATDPTRISGGSSSGSAVAVAHGACDFALGTDTAGSGRVPAAFHGLFGVKPTKGWVPASGVVPACRTQDVVTAMAKDLALAELVVSIMSGSDPRDPLSRDAPTVGSSILAHGIAGSEAPDLDVPVIGTPRLGVPRAGQLGELAPGWAEAFEAAVEGYERAGAELVEVDIRFFLDTARMLYEGAFAAERYAAVGEFIDAHPGEVDPTVGGIIQRAKEIPAWRLYQDLEQLERQAARSAETFRTIDALILPTTVRHPTLAEVAEEPIAANSALGRFTNFANLLDLAALATPAGTVDGLPFGVQLVGPAFTDARLADIARLVL